MVRRFTPMMLCALTAIGLSCAPGWAQASGPAKAAKVRSTKVGQINDFIFIYSEQNRVPSCSANIADVTGKVASFTLTSDPRGNIHKLVLPPFPATAPGKLIKVQIKSVYAPSWSGEFDARTYADKVEVSLPSFIGPSSLVGGFSVSSEWGAGTWFSTIKPTPETPTAMTNIFRGLEVCLAGKQVM